MKKLFNLITLLLISVIFTGCHFIKDDKNLIVIEKRMSKNTNYKYFYVIKNPSTVFNTEFYSNRNFEIGDTLKLEVD